MRTISGKCGSGKTWKMLIEGLKQAQNDKKVICISKSRLAREWLKEELEKVVTFIGADKSLIDNFVFLSESEVLQGGICGIGPSFVMYDNYDFAKVPIKIDLVTI